MNLGDFDYYFIEKEFYYINVNRKNVCNSTGWQWQVERGGRIGVTKKKNSWTQYFHRTT